MKGRFFKSIAGSLMIIYLINAPWALCQPKILNENEGHIIKWQSLGTSETTKNIPATKRNLTGFSRLDLENYLLAQGKIKKEDMQIPKDAKQIPTVAAIDPCDYAAYLSEIRNKIDIGLLLDKMDEKPDKNRKMNRIGLLYHDLLGKNWINESRSKRVNKLEEEIQKKMRMINDAVCINWIQIDNKIIGITAFRTLGDYDLWIECAELLNLLCIEEYPEVIKRTDQDGYQCIVFDPIFCKGIPSQIFDVDESFKRLSVVGIIGNNIVMYAGNTVIFYDLDADQFHVDVVEEHSGQEIFLLLVRNKIYKLTIKMDADNSRMRYLCAFWEGTISPIINN